jgi:hypothetical protein
MTPRGGDSEEPVLERQESTESMRANERFSPVPWTLSPPMSPPPGTEERGACTGVDSRSGLMSPRVDVRVGNVERALEEFRAVERAFERSPYVIPPEILAPARNEREVGVDAVEEVSNREDVMSEETVDETRRGMEAISGDDSEFDGDDHDASHLHEILEDYTESIPSSPFIEDTNFNETNELPPLLLEPPSQNNPTTITRMPSIQRRGQEILRQYILKRSGSPPAEYSAPTIPFPTIESFKREEQEKPEEDTKVSDLGQKDVPAQNNFASRTITHAIPLTTVILIVLLTLSLIFNIVQYAQLRRQHISQQRIWDDVMTPGVVGETFEIFVHPSKSWWSPWTTEPESLPHDANPVEVISGAGTDGVLQVARGLSFGMKGKRIRLEGIEGLVRARMEGVTKWSLRVWSQIWERLGR